MSFSTRLEALGKRLRPVDADTLRLTTAALLDEAAAADMLRRHQNDPTMLALSIERSRDLLDRIGWGAVLIGLVFTTANVAAFVGGWAGWLVEPMIMGFLLVLMRGEQLAARHNERSDPWVVGTRRGALVVTYVMNTWTSWATILPGGQNAAPSEIFKHSIPPIAVFCAVEALAKMRATLTRIASRVVMSWRGPTVSPVFWPSPRDIQPPADDSPTVEIPLAPVEIPLVPAEEPQDEPQETVVPKSRPVGRKAYGEVKAAMTKAFRELAVHTDYREIRPVEVDRHAGLVPGTTKRKIKELRREYEEEVIADGESVEQVVAVGR